MVDRTIACRKSDIPKVAVLLQTSGRVCRDTALGIRLYTRQHGPWSVYFGSCEYQRLVPKLAQWGASGIIASIPNVRLGRALADAGLPTVAINVSDRVQELTSEILNRSDASFDAAEPVAELAKQHFLERGFTHFAFVGVEEVVWSERREEAFRKQLASSGHKLLAYRQPARERDLAWVKEQVMLSDWLRKLPTPIGILACNDEHGRMVLDCCRMAELQVPEQVAVLGVDNDEFFCNLAEPPLSSIALGAQSTGFEMAELLDGIMQGLVRKPRHLAVKTIGVITRRSTDILAGDDADVAVAMRFIRESYSKPISVASVADAVLMSRRSLEKRFRRVLGRSVLEEIQIVRIETAKRLLLESEHSTAKVAQLSGFGSVDYFIRFFRQKVGVPPSRFRGDHMG
jgi:LacI family transcriptional regulator